MMKSFTEMVSSWIGKEVTITLVAGNPVSGKLLAINSHLNIILEITEIDDQKGKIPCVIRGSNIVSIILGGTKNERR